VVLSGGEVVGGEVAVTVGGEVVSGEVTVGGEVAVTVGGGVVVVGGQVQTT
jgi:hypothetical protein